MSPPKGFNMAQNGLYVFVIDDQNHAAGAPGQGRAPGYGHAVISEGLKEGDRVVTSGQFLLQPGSIVTIDAGSGT